MGGCEHGLLGQRGLEYISLSVARANPAAALYRTEGYRVITSREHVDTMLPDLWNPGGDTTETGLTQDT